MGRPRAHGMTVRYAPHPRRVASWGVFWRADAHGERRKLSQFFPTEAEALAFRDAYQGKLARYDLVQVATRSAAAAVATPPALPPATCTVDQFVAYWWTRHPPPSASARRSYRAQLDAHILPWLGSARLADLTAPILLDFLARRGDAGVRRGTQVVILGVLSSILGSAAFYYTRVNPCQGLKKRLLKAAAYVDPTPNPLSADQADRFLEWLRTGIVVGVDRPVDGPRGRGGRVLPGRAGYPDLYPYFLALIETGMRRGEAAALQWSHVYLEAAVPYLRIARSYSPSAVIEGGDGEVPTKSKRARDVAISPPLLDALRALARTRKARAFAAGRRESPYVFLGVRGARILSDASAAERVFVRGMAAIGAADEAHTIHDLRDTFATLHLAAHPGQLAWVSAMLGHRQVSTTLNRYTKWVPSMTTTAPTAGLMPRRPLEGTR